MRSETITAWMFVGFGLLAVGTLLHMFEVNGEVGRFLEVMGLLYIGMGFVLAVMHDRHMAQRARAGRERE